MIEPWMEIAAKTKRLEHIRSELSLVRTLIIEHSSIIERTKSMVKERRISNPSSLIMVIVVERNVQKARWSSLGRAVGKAALKQAILLGYSSVSKHLTNNLRRLFVRLQQLLAFLPLLLDAVIFVQ